MGIFKKGIGCGVVLVGGFFLVGGCVAVMVASQDESSRTSDDSGTAAGGASTAPAPATPSNNAYASKVQDIVLDGLWLPDRGRPATFADMCETTVVWACAIAKIESDDAGSVEITLQPESVWISKWDGSTDWYDFGEHVARGVYNFTNGSIRPPLTEIDVRTSTGDIAYLGNF